MRRWHALVRGVNYCQAVTRVGIFGGCRWAADAKQEERSMTSASMLNQVFRIGVGFFAWCAIRQILMVWLTYV